MGLVQILLKVVMFIHLIKDHTVYTQDESNPAQLPPSLIRPIAAHIAKDDFTARLIKELFETEPSKEFRYYINLGLNNMVTMNEFYKSLSSDGMAVKIPELMDAFNIEKFMLQQTHDGKANQTEEETLDANYWNEVTN